MAEPAQRSPEDEPAPSARPAPPKTGGRSLTHAVATALVLLAAMTMVAVVGRLAFFVLVCVVVIAALFELLDAVARSGRKPVVSYALACGLLLLASAYRAEPPLVALTVGVTAFGSLVLALRPGRGATPASDAAWTVLGVVWIAGGGAAATGILVGEPSGMALLMAFIITAAADDIVAYFVGTRFGRRRMAPSISPAKSWEGFAGGLAGALVAGALAGAVVPVLSPLHGLGLGAICGVAAPAGDLVESLAKRELGIKDSGRLLPGHGGFLDRLDGILFCAPAALAYLHLTLS
ncbi:MAG: phosphatidate cytidylyltransferase [Actinomycetota bacterium]